MKKALVVLLALAGCSSTSTSLGRAEKEAVWNPPMDAYLRCNILTSRRVARQSGDPVSLGLAVTSMCVREKQALMAAFAKTDGDAFALKFMTEIDRGQVKMNAGEIVKARG